VVRLVLRSPGRSPSRPTQSVGIRETPVRIRSTVDHVNPAGTSGIFAGFGMAAGFVARGFLFMGVSKSLRRLAGLISAAVVVLAVGGCSSGYESYMADACDGLRTMATGYESKDRDAFDEGYTQVWNLDPAGEEAAGDKALTREVHRLWNAQRLLRSAWRGLQLSERDQDKIQQGIETCEQY
jgi:hypothetical protein